MSQAINAMAAAAATTTAWQPASAQVQAVERHSQAYYAAWDGHRYQDAYKMPSPTLTQLASHQKWQSDMEATQAKTGTVQRRDIKKITCYKDPPHTAPGTHAAVDFSSQFSNADIHCG